MMKNHLLLLIALFAALTGYGKKTSTGDPLTATDSIEHENLTGTWIIDTTVIKQTVDSVSTTKIYLPGDTAVTFVRRPQKITFTANGIIFEYSDGMLQSGTYTVEGDKLLVGFPTHGAIYRYSLPESGKLQLYHTAQYVIDGVHQAEEQCIFKGRTTSKTEY